MNVNPALGHAAAQIRGARELASDAVHVAAAATPAPTPTVPSAAAASNGATAGQRLIAGRAPDSTTDAAAQARLARVDETHARLLADPATTRDSLLRDLRAVLAKDEKRVTADELAFVAALDRMPAELALDLPPAWRASRADLVASGKLPDGYLAPRAELRSLRLWDARTQLVADPATTREALRADLAGRIGQTDGSVRSEDIERIGVLDGLPAHLALDLPPDATALGRHGVAVEGLGVGNSRDARLELQNLRLWQRANELAADPAVTRETLRDDLRAVLAKPQPLVGPRDVAFLAVLDRLPASKSLELPAPANPATTREAMGLGVMTPSGYRETRAELLSLRMWDAATSAVAPGATRESLLADLRRILDKPDREITDADMARVAAYDDLPEHLALDLPPSASPGGRRHTAETLVTRDNSVGVRAEMQNLRVWDINRRIDEQARVAGDVVSSVTGAPTSTRETVLGELRAILAKRDGEIDGTDLAHIAAFERLTGDLALGMPPSLVPGRRDEVMRIGRSPESNIDARREIDALRIWSASTDPALTRERAAADVAEVLAKPDQQVSRDDMFRLAVATSLTGDRDLALPRAVTAAGRGELVSMRALPTSSGAARAELNALRAWGSVQAELADTSVTTDALLAELGTLAASPALELSQAAVQRIGELAVLLRTKGIELPNPSGEAGLLQPTWGNMSTGQAGSFESELRTLRPWLELNTDAGMQRVQAKVASGELLPHELVRAYASGVGAGSGSPQLRAHMLRSVAEPDWALDRVSERMRIADQLLAGAPTLDPRSGAVIAKARALLAANIERRPFPDYAQVGSAMTLGKAGLAMEVRAAEAAAAAPAPASVRLTWSPGA